MAPKLLSPQPPPLLVEVYFVAWINYHLLDRSIIQPPTVPRQLQQLAYRYSSSHALHPGLGNIKPVDCVRATKSFDLV